MRYRNHSLRFGIALIGFMATVEAQAVEGSLAGAEAQMMEIKEKTGSAPSIKEFRQIMVDVGSDISLQDLGSMWGKFRRMQRPVISRDQLIELMTVKRESIDNYKIAYNEYINPNIPGGSGFHDVELTQSGRLVLLSEKKGASEDNMGSLMVTAYDGKVIRHYERKTKSGRIDEFEDLGRIIDIYTPMAQMMLLNADFLFTDPPPKIDLAKFIKEYPCVVQEKAESMGGRDGLIVLGDLADTFWLDPKLGFAIVKHESGLIAYNNKERSYKVSGKGYTDTFEDWRKIGDGVEFYLPYSIKRVGMMGGKEVMYSNTKIRDAQINNIYQEAYFSDIFPRDTMVNDYPRNIIFVMGQTPNIAGSIDATVRPQAARIPFSLIAGNLIALTIVVIVYSYRTKNKGEKIA